MNSVTLGQLNDFIITFASVLTAGGVIVKVAVNISKKVLCEALEPFNKRIDETIENNNAKFKELQLQTDKNYLVRFLADVEKGEEVDETEMEHFYYTYESYHKNGGNSYIDHKVEKLKKEGKL